MGILNSIPVSRLPMPAMIAVSVLTGGSILGLAFFLLGNSPSRNTAMMVLVVGMIFVALLLALFRAIVKWNQKRKANPMTAGIAGNAAAAPQGISEPARRARLDDLRRNFEQGVEKFRAAGKNLYSVPWYVLVGEPGSGKTEAIRHCNVGFPPGLQDQLQGAGGTLNMNWWFTNSAIILDTAGRLMFEEVAPGSTNEWNEFLKLLKQNRPNSPVNGLLLVIPVDTLIKDSADAIEKKATKIAQQFDQIQRTLGVRFPVFVIITKCDLLNGFREFFDDLNDPQLQHQIMGWSNPAPLDQRFDPANVTTHLESVRTRLIGRRQNLLLDPVNTEDQQARRVDQVDSLFALPDSITKIGPRLRRYLEMIFVAGEWSPKPLFLRGIYFTSSMTEGAALDAELAEALGVPVDSLPGGAIFRKDRAYFLRDLFLEKVFREKGLVTRATNADKQQRSRRAIVLGFGFISVLILFSVTWLGYRSLDKSLGAERSMWEGESNLDFKLLNLVDNRGNYQGDPDVVVAGKSITRADFFGQNLDRVKNDLHIPLIFRPMAVFTNDINAARRNAYRDLFGATVLKPAYDSARAKIAGEPWDPKKGPALIQLMKLEYAKGVGVLPPSETAHPQVEIAPLFAVSLSADDYAKFAKDKDPLQQVADWVYTAQAKGDAAWPPKILLPDTSTANRDAIKIGIDAAIAYWTTQSTDTGASFDALKNVQKALNDYKLAEAAIATAKDRSINNIEEYHSYREVWLKQMDALRDAAKRVAEAWTTASSIKAGTSSLRALYEFQKNQTADKAQKAYDDLLAVTPAPEAAKDNDSFRALVDARTKLVAAEKTLKDWANAPSNKATLDELSALDAAYLMTTIKGTDSADHFPYEVHQQLYELADKAVIKDDASVQLTERGGAMADAFVQADKSAADAVTAINSPLRTSGAILASSATLAQFTVESSARAKKYLLADGALKNMPETSEKWQAAVKALVAKGGQTPDSLRRPSIPLVTFVKDDRIGDDEKTFAAAFCPDVAGDAYDKLDTISKLASLADAATKILNPVNLTARSTTARKGFTAYRADYIIYWRDTVKEEIKFNFPSYKSFASSLVNVGESGIRSSLDDYGKKMTGALERIGALDEVNTIKSVGKVAVPECEKALGSWNNLGTDPNLARRSVLSLDSNAFRTDYFVATARGNDGYVARYWTSLPIEALRILAADGRKDIDDSLKILANYERFPLAPAGDPKIDLTQDDIIKAREALIQVRGAASAAAAAAAGAPISKIIGQGGNTGVIEIDNMLVTLRGTDLFAPKKDYFDKLDKFLAGMPTDAKPLGVTFSADKAKLKDVTDTISQRYSYMQVTQDKKEVRVVSLISADKVDSCTLTYSGGDISLGFRESDTGPNLQSETFSGPWALLRLLASPNVKSYSRDPATNKWSIEYIVKDKITGAPRALWLTLEFKQPLPDLKEWPVPPGR